MSAAKDFVEAVSKRASEEGWKVRLGPIGFQWKKGEEAKDMVRVATSNGAEGLHAACVWLDENQNWKTSISYV